MTSYVITQNMTDDTISMEDFFSESPKWYDRIGEIYALLERVIISEERSSDVLKLRRLNRIMSVHASTAIEGNLLSLDQVTDVVNGMPVWGPPKDIKEIQNAWQAYNRLEEYDPWDVMDFLSAHASMTDALIGESGKFRSVGVSVVTNHGMVIHKGSEPEDVPDLVKKLLEWGKGSDVHPLIKSSAVHFMIEHIHPFRDGNGRIGRLWQTLILSKWNPLFLWMPVETLIHHNQRRYYSALRDSNRNDLDCRPFIDLMLDIIADSLRKYVEMPVRDEVVFGLELKKCILSAVRSNPSVSAKDIATNLGKSSRTVERHINDMREMKVLKREGSKKTGIWVISGTL